MPVPEKEKKRSNFSLCKTDRSLHTYPGYQRTFSHCTWRNTLVLACHYKDETETGNCAWKVSGTQGIAQTLQWKKAGNVLQNRCECLFVFTFLVFDLLLKIIKAWESLKQIIYTHVPCTSDIMPKWTWLSLESFKGKKIDSLTPLLSLNIFIDPWCIFENLSLLMGEKLLKACKKRKQGRGAKEDKKESELRQNPSL